MQIAAYFDEPTFTLTYLVWDEATRDALVVDPVLDYDPLSSTTSTASVDRLAADVEAQGLKLHLVLETHAHADHLSGSQALRARFGAQVVIGAAITDVQRVFKAVFDLPPDFATDGNQFDRLVRDGERLEAGSLSIQVVTTPGHTPACVSYLIGDAVFTGDALFMPDYGTGRCDFPLGSAAALYRSIHDKLYALPDATRVFTGHDYQPGGRELRYESTIGEQKAKNVQLRQETSEGEFVEFRNRRDAGLRAPRLLYPSVQVNVNAGRLPPAHANGVRYLQIPLNRTTPTDDAGVPRPGGAG